MTAGGRRTNSRLPVLRPRRASRCAPRAEGAKRRRRFSVQFEQFLELLDTFVRETGDAAVLYSGHIGNFPLGHRATYYRRRYRQGLLSPEQMRVLEDRRRFPGWTWHPLAARFALGIRRLRRFIAREGHAAVPPSHIERGFRLGAWVSHRRHERRTGQLPEALARALERIPGWSWKPGAERFAEGLRHLMAYVAREGHARVPSQHTEGAFRLGSWVSHRRRAHLLLDRGQVQALERLPGWTWDVRHDEFERARSILASYVRRVGHARVAQKHVERGFPLGAWVARVRLRYRDTSSRGLSEGQVRCLEALPGWTWGRERRPSRQSEHR